VVTPRSSMVVRALSRIRRRRWLNTLRSASKTTSSGMSCHAFRSAAAHGSRPEDAVRRCDGRGTPRRAACGRTAPAGTRHQDRAEATEPRALGGGPGPRGALSLEQAIARHLHLDRKTVRKFARASSPEAISTRAPTPAPPRSCDGSTATSTDRNSIRVSSL
jgi:hypothetical protein